MRFTKTFDNEGIKAYLDDIYNTIFYSWSEYDPIVCDPNDESKLKELGEELFEKIEEISDLIDQMGSINKNSFEC